MNKKLITVNNQTKDFKFFTTTCRGKFRSGSESIILELNLDQVKNQDLDFLMTRITNIYICKSLDQVLLRSGS